MPLLKSRSFSRKSSSNLSGSFWDPPNYKETTKRVEDGEKLVRDFVQMVEERRDIEKDYAKQLQAWSDKWMKVQEYGTLKTAWRAVAMEGVKRASVHLAVREDVDNQVIEPMRVWHKETYHRQRNNKLKEKKELGEQFKTAQKEWAELLNKQTTAKTEYMAACKEEERAVKAEREATKNPDLSQTQLNKLQDKIKNSQQEIKIKHEKYSSSIQELNSRQNVYQQGMIQVYNKFEVFEEKRYLTVQMFMLLLQDCLNVHRNLDLSQIYDESREAINQVDHEKDLSWWSDNHGINIEHTLPEFEEYSTNIRNRSSSFSIDSIRQMIPEYQDSSTRSRSASFNTSRNSQVLSKYQEHSKDAERKLSISNLVNTKEDIETTHKSLTETTLKVHETPTIVISDPFEPTSKRLVEAQFPYDGVEEDELSFDTGDVIELIEDKDDDGWCIGKLGDKEGYFPADYCKLLR